MGLKLNIGQILTIAQVIPGIVSNVQRAFGKEPGATRKAAAQEAARDVLVAVEGATGKDLLNDANFAALVDEAIEIGVTQMKLAKRMAEIDDIFKTLRAKD